MNLIRNTLSRFVSSVSIAGCSVRIMRNDEVCPEKSKLMASMYASLE